jgi:hypothetical protein
MEAIFRQILSHHPLRPPLYQFAIQLANIGSGLIEY